MHNNHEEATTHFETLANENLSSEALLAVDALRAIVLQQADTINEMQVRLTEAEDQSHIDSLTLTGNRRAFDRDIERTFRSLSDRRRETDIHHVLLIIGDLDNFKLVNDVLGYNYGDNVLAFIAKTLQESVRQTDNIYRLGGDEFAVMAPVIPGRETEAYNAITERFYNALDDIRDKPAEELPEEMNSTDIEALRTVDMSFAHGIFTTSHATAAELVEISEQTMRDMKTKKEEKGGSIR